MTNQTKQRKWILVSEENLIPKNEGKKVIFENHEIALFRVGTEYCAVDNSCPHKGGPLADGIVAGKSVFCPLHNWKINLENGCALSGGRGKVKTYPVKVLNNQVYVAFEEGKFHEDTNEELGSAVEFD